VLFRSGFAGIAFTQAEAGHGADALRWADELNNPVIRSRALMGLAQGLAARRRKTDETRSIQGMSTPALPGPRTGRP
jgi:hypothetical protein